MYKGTAIRKHLVGLGHARSSLGLDQKVQAGAGPEKGLEEGWVRFPRSQGSVRWAARSLPGLLRRERP